MYGQRPPLPGRLRDAGDFSLERERAEAQTAKSELTQVAARASAAPCGPCGGTSAPVYIRIGQVLFKDKPPVPFRIPPGLRIVRVDHDSGLPSSGPNSIDEAFKPGTEPNEYGAQGPQTAGAGATVAGDQPWNAGGRWNSGGSSGGGDPNAATFSREGGAATGIGGGGRRPTLSGTGETY